MNIIVQKMTLTYFSYYGIIVCNNILLLLYYFTLEIEYSFCWISLIKLSTYNILIMFQHKNNTSN